MRPEITHARPALSDATRRRKTIRLQRQAGQAADPRHNAALMDFPSSNFIVFEKKSFSTHTSVRAGEDATATAAVLDDSVLSLVIKSQAAVPRCCCRSRRTRRPTAHLYDRRSPLPPPSKRSPVYQSKRARTARHRTQQRAERHFLSAAKPPLCARPRVPRP